MNIQHGYTSTKQGNCGKFHKIPASFWLIWQKDGDGHKYLYRKLAKTIDILTLGWYGIYSPKQENLSFEASSLHKRREEYGKKEILL